MNQLATILTATVLALACHAGLAWIPTGPFRPNNVGG